MKRTAILCSILLLTISGTTLLAQKRTSKKQQTSVNTPLKKLLWSTLKCNCSEFEEEESVSKEVVEDISNGYLSFFCSYPPCGCSCQTISAAFKTEKGKYITLSRHTESCAQTYELTASKNLPDLLPKGLSLKTFAPSQSIFVPKGCPMFYLDLEIPRYGSEVVASLKVIPFGFCGEGTAPLTTAYLEGESFVASELLANLPEVSSKKAWEYAATEQWNKLSRQDMRRIKEHLAGVEKGIEMLKRIKQVYDVYIKLEATRMVMKWNRAIERFEIVRLDRKPKLISFDEFFLQAPCLQAIC